MRVNKNMVEKTSDQDENVRIQLCFFGTLLISEVKPYYYRETFFLF